MRMKQVMQFLAVVLVAGASTTALAGVGRPDQSLLNIAETAVEAGPAPAFSVFEHRATHPPAAKAAMPVAISATRRAKTSANRTAKLKLRPLIWPLVTAAEFRHALPAGLLDALIAVESAYRPGAVSAAGAAGLAQLMPETARSLGVVDRFDILANIEGGARYLRAQLDRFDSIALALAAYNAGPGAVRRAGGIPRNGETPVYVSKVLAAWSALAGTPA